MNTKNPAKDSTDEDVLRDFSGVWTLEECSIMKSCVLDVFSICESSMKTDQPQWCEGQVEVFCGEQPNLTTLDHTIIGSRRG